jgi:CRP/FNR family transcriptional regulator, cyclic AMP receptor protein
MPAMISLRHTEDAVQAGGCRVCRHRHRAAFCDLSEPALRDLEVIASPTSCAKGEFLFHEGDEPRGVYIVCGGPAKLSVGARNGKLLLRIAAPGELLGLSAAISGSPYECSAEMMISGRVSYVRRDDFLRFIRRHGDAGLRVAHQLSRDYFTVHDQMRSIVLSGSVAEKLARLLLNWCEARGEETAQGTRLKLSLTHAEVAQMIGTSRESVTRQFGEFKARGLIRPHGEDWLICDRETLAGLVSY